MWRILPLPSSNKSAFRAAGLIAFNPKEVLSRFTKQLNSPTLTSSRSSTSVTETPYDLKQLDKLAAIVKKLIRDHA